MKTDQDPKSENLSFEKLIFGGLENMTLSRFFVKVLTDQTAPKSLVF